jgi:starch phosphorylase
MVRVDAVYGAVNQDGVLTPAGSTRLELRGRERDGVFSYEGVLTPEGAGRFGYTIRVTPDHPDLPEAAAPDLVLWA